MKALFIFIFTAIMVFLPYTMSNAIVDMQPGGWTLALMGAHYTDMHPTSFTSRMYGEFIALMVASFFFMWCWSLDEPRWRYFIISLFVYNLWSWFPAYAVGLTVLYLVFGMSRFVIDETHVWVGRQLQQPIPVTPVQPDPALVAEIARRKKAFADRNAKPSQIPLKPYSQFDTSSDNGNIQVPPYKGLGSVQPVSATDYTSSYPPETFRHEKRNSPVTGVRWFGQAPNGRPLSTGWGITKHPGQGGWDDIGQITASHVPTPDNAAGAYAFEPIMIGSDAFDRMNEPGGFVAEVEMWGQIVYHPNERVYRAEKAKIKRVICTYQEWVSGGMREKYQRKRGI